MKIIIKACVLFSLMFIVVSGSDKLPFIGKRFLAGGIDIIDTIEINKDGFTTIESHYGTKVSVLYQGPYKKAMRISQVEEIEYIIEGNEVCDASETGYFCRPMFKSKNDLLKSYKRRTSVTSDVFSLLESAEKDCENGNGEQCFYVGEMYQHGADGLNPNPAYGWTYMKQGCYFGSAKACSNIAKAYEDGMVKDSGEKFPFVAAQFYKKGCGYNDQESCNKYQILSQKIGTLKLEKDCDSGNMEACLEFGKYFLEKDTRLHYLYSLETAVNLFKKACYSENINSCEKLLNIYQNKKYDYGRYEGDGSILNDKMQITKFYIKSRKVAIKLCEKNNAASCDYVGKLYTYGLGARTDYSKAVKYYSKACELGNSNGCLGVAALYKMDGSRLGSDIKTTVENSKKIQEDMLIKACDLKNEIGCRFLAYNYDNSPQRLKAYKYYVKACMYGNVKECAHMGKIYEKGDKFYKLDKDINLAKKLYKKGCELGNEKSCLDYEILNDDE